jgi:hypothetical protein
MATAQEQQLAANILVAWLNSAPMTAASMEGLQSPATAGRVLGELYKTLVNAVSDTSAPVAGRDATG